VYFAKYSPFTAPNLWENKENRLGFDVGGGASPVMINSDSPLYPPNEALNIKRAGAQKRIEDAGWTYFWCVSEGMCQPEYIRAGLGFDVGGGPARQ